MVSLVDVECGTGAMELGASARNKDLVEELGQGQEGTRPHLEVQTAPSIVSH